jgi:hypothetical protein
MILKFECSIIEIVPQKNILFQSERRKARIILFHVKDMQSHIA